MYYRFISKEELQTLLSKGVVKSKHNDGIHVLHEETNTWTIPNELNGKVTTDMLPEFEHSILKKEDFLWQITGIVSEDYLVEISGITPQRNKLGYYYVDDDRDIVLEEFLIDEYSIDQVTNVYEGDFYDFNVTPINLKR